MDLIIVESPSKAKTITKYLQGKYIVDASAGHIRDLPEKRIGVSIKNDFEPTYEITPSKADIIKRLQNQVKKAENVFLATDPDREGESISWHLQHVLGLDPNAENRIEFNEISPKAVQAALKTPRKVNMSLVDAQQARRVLDRLVGYQLSPLLCKRICSGLSAGRVQSVALKLIVDREREIQAFVPEEYWLVHATVSDQKKEYAPFKMALAKKDGKKFRPSNREQTDEVVAAVDKSVLSVTKLKKSVSKSHAPAPFTTSTLQQDGAAKFGMTAPEIMQIAQHLYEGVDTSEEGHVAFVTYIRTDSVRVSQEAQASARAFIGEKYGKDYVPAKPNVYKTKKDAQDAHEAIRPIDVRRTPESVKGLLDSKHYKVYKLIYDRFIASQMADAKYDTVQLEAVGGRYGFTANGRVMIFKGFTAAYQESTEPKANEAEEQSVKNLPPLEVGSLLDVQKMETEQKFTKPPLRFTDSTLVKTMEENGIGRPSTYATIISVLTKRKYVEKQGKNMVPTEVAYQITDMLCAHFKDIMDVRFTAKMEDQLDGIETSGTEWKQIIRDFYPPFAKQLIVASKEGEEETDILCEKCGKAMIRKRNKYGSFLACSGYPKCKNIVSEGEQEVSDKLCPKCNANMIVKIGRYGKYLACSNFPECQEILSMQDEVSEHPCPTCKTPLVLKSGRYGKYFRCECCQKNLKADRSGKPIVIEEEPSQELCPECGKNLTFKSGRYGRYLRCDACAKNFKCDKDGKVIVNTEEVSNVICSGCNEPYKIKVGRYGRYYRCDACNKNVKIPKEEA